MNRTGKITKGASYLLAAAAVAGSAVVVFDGTLLAAWVGPVAAVAVIPLFLLISRREVFRSLLFLSFLLVAVLAGTGARHGGTADVERRREAEFSRQERAMSLVAAEGGRIEEFARELARRGAALDGFREAWTRERREEAFRTLEEEAGSIPPEWKGWGIGVEFLDRAGDPVAWWGDVPDLDEPRRQSPLSILTDPARLHLVAHLPVVPEGWNEEDPAGTVRVILPVGANPFLEGRFGSEIPFAAWLDRQVGAEVVLYPSGMGRGRSIHGEGEGSGVIGRAEIAGPRPALDRPGLPAGADAACRAMLLLFWLSLFRWRRPGMTEGEGAFREAVAGLAIGPVIVLRLLLLVFGLPGRLPWFRAVEDAGSAGGGVAALLGTVGSAPEIALTAATLLAVVVILHERLLVARRGDRAAPPLNPYAVAAVLALLSALTALFWAGLPRLVNRSPDPLFAGPVHMGDAQTVLMELALFLLVASYLLLVDAGFVWATRFGLAGRAGIARISLPLRFLLAALFGAATLLLSHLAVFRGWLLPLAPFVTVTTGLLLLFLLRGRGWRLWNGLGFVAAAALVAHSPVRIAQADAERAAVAERALRYAEPRDEAKRKVLEKALRFFMSDDTIAGQLTATGGNVNERSAFYAWVRSGLSGYDYSCDLKILDRQGAVASRFSMDMPADSPVRAAFVFRALRTDRELRIVEGRRRIRNETVHVYTGAAPIVQEGELVGAVIVSMPYFVENLEYAAAPAGRPSEIFRGDGGGVRASPRFPGDVHVFHYGGEGPVRSSGDQPPPLAAPSEELIEQVVEGGPLWREAQAGGRRYDIFYTGWKDPDREGILAFALPKRTAAEQLFLLIDMILTFLLLSALLVVLLVPAAVAWSYFRRPGAPLLVELTFEDKLVLALLLVALLPAVLLGSAGRRMVDGYVREAGENEARASLQTVRYALRQETIREAEELARSTFVRRRVLEVEDDELINLELGLKRFGIFSPGGELILQNGRIGSVDPEALREVRERRLPVSYFEGGEELSIVALVGIVIEGYETGLQGILLLSRPIDEAWAVDLGERVGRDLTFFRGGAPVASTRSELYQAGVLPGRLPASVYLNLELGGEKVRFGHESVAGRPYRVGYGVMRDYRGEAVGTIAVPFLFREDEAGADTARAYAAITYLTFLTVIVVVIVAVLIGRRIARPVADLTGGMARVSAGRLDFTIARRAGGEIGNLVDSFNRMIRELRISRDALTERSRFIETILRSVAAGVIAFDRGDCVVSLNLAAGRLLDMPVEGALSRRIEELPGRRIGAFRKVLDDLDRSAGTLLESEIELPGGDGRITLRVVASRLTDHEGEELGKVLVFEDLTTLIQSKKLLAWGEMARQVAHEIKNPLTPIKLSAQQIRRAYHDRHERFGQILDESTELIIEEIEALRRIATEFSAFARMPKRKIEEVKPGALITEVVRLYEESMGRGRIAASLPGELPAIRVDREEIRRVVINLFENALQATGRGGEIEVTAGVADGPPANDEGWEVWESTPEKPKRGRLLVIRIRDDGPGVSEAARGKLFEPNFSTKTDGTGLGLAISRSIVEGYGGSIVIGSSPGRGSVAIVSLPV